MRDAELGVALLIVLLVLVLTSLLIDVRQPEPEGVFVADTVLVYVTECGGKQYRSYTELECRLP